MKLILQKCVYGLIILSFLITDFVWAVEVGFKEGKNHTAVSINRDYLKGDNFSAHNDTARMWSDIELSWDIDNAILTNNELSWRRIADIKLAAYPIMDYNLTKGEAEFSLRKGYVATRIKNTYISIGKQTIIWGVGKGANPTNYLMKLQLFDKQRSPELSLEGIECLMVEFPVKNVSIETVFQHPEEIENATRFKTFVWDTDLSFSFYTNKDRPQVGLDFEKDLHGWFGIYGELAMNTKDVDKDYQFVAGISKVIPYFSRSNIDFEYQQNNFKNKDREEIFTIQTLISPMEELSFLSLISYFSNKDVTLSMVQASYTIGKKVELLVTSTFKSNNVEDPEFFPFNYIISPRVIYYF